MNDVEWFDITGGYTGSVSYSRIAKRTRFIVLSPAKDPNRLRPTLCAGDFVDGECVVDSGLISPAMKLELESLCRIALGIEGPV